MAQPIEQVILKVFFYLLDVLSDWVNGAEQIGMDIDKGQKSQPNCSETTGNDGYSGKNGQAPEVRYSGRFR